MNSITGPRNLSQLKCAFAISLVASTVADAQSLMPVTCSTANPNTRTPVSSWAMRHRNLTLTGLASQNFEVAFEKPSVVRSNSPNDLSYDISSASVFLNRGNNSSTGNQVSIRYNALANPRVTYTINATTFGYNFQDPPGTVPAPFNRLLVTLVASRNPSSGVYQFVRMRDVSFTLNGNAPAPVARVREAEGVAGQSSDPRDF